MTSSVELSPVIRKKGETQNGGNKKIISTPNFLKNDHFLPRDTCRLNLRDSRPRFLYSFVNNVFLIAFAITRAAFY